MASTNFYDVLGVSRDATVEEIKKAFKKAALLHHPDKGGDPEKFKEIGAANETLTDERKRAAYDSQLLRARSRDGMRNYADRDASSDRTRQASASRPSYERAPSSGAAWAGPPPARPPRPPAGAAVEIPADPSSLSSKELKELLTALGIDHEGCLEKGDLLELLRNRKERRASTADGRGDSTPRGGGAASSGGPRPQASTPRERAAAAEEKAAGAATASPSPPPPGARGPRALRVKVMSLGSGAVGKSTLIKRYCEGRFVQKYITTIGIDYGVKPVKVLGHDLKVNFFDTSGGEEFRDIRTEFYGMGETNGVLLVFDVTNRKSFAELDDWINEAKRYNCPLSKLHRSGDAETPFVILLANKTDLPRRVVPKADAMQFASKHGMYYYETSAQSGDNVVESMTYLFEKVVGHHLEVRKRLGAG